MILWDDLGGPLNTGKVMYLNIQLTSALMGLISKSCFSHFSHPRGSCLISALINAYKCLTVSGCRLSC